jgi:prepilin-type N-terminal cleavage/methylation domain-containing protein
MERRPAKRRRSAGFTLIEVILALSLAGLIIAVFSGTFVQTVFTERQLAGRVTGLIIGQGKLAELELGSEPASSGRFDPPYESFHWFSKEETADDGSQRIHLTVTWEAPNGAPHRLLFQGYRR